MTNDDRSPSFFYMRLPIVVLLLISTGRSHAEPVASRQVSLGAVVYQKVSYLGFQDEFSDGKFDTSGSAIGVQVEHVRRLSKRIECGGRIELLQLTGDFARSHSMREVRITGVLAVIGTVGRVGLRAGLDAGYQLGIMKRTPQNDDFVGKSHGASASLLGGLRVPISLSWSGFVDLSLFGVVYTTGGFDVIGGWLARTTVGASYGW